LAAAIAVSSWSVLATTAVFPSAGAREQPATTATEQMSAARILILAMTILPS
jgi:hypothetical protein